jgi:hypothetical protein
MIAYGDVRDSVEALPDGLRPPEVPQPPGVDGVAVRPDRPDAPSVEGDLEDTVPAARQVHTVGVDRRRT